MTKREFLSTLDARLGALSLSDKEKSLEYYAEMIDDRTEEGMDEAAAIEAIGSVEEVAAQILMEMPLTMLMKPKRTPRNLGLWLCALPLLIVFGAAALALLISYWSVILSLLVSFFAVVAALFGGALGGICIGIVLIVTRYPLQGIAYVGAGCVCAGLGMLASLGIRPVWRCALRLFAAPVRLLKMMIVGRSV